MNLTEYRNLYESELSRALFCHFIRHQVVGRCWRREEGQWVIRDAPFIDDWTEQDYQTLLSSLRQTLQQGGLVCGAFRDGQLKGFAVVKSRPAGPRQEYLDLAELHVSEDVRGQGVGTALFRDGLMVGTLDGLETSLLNAIHGSTVFFNYSPDGMPVSLQSHGMTDLRIENMEDGRLRIAFDLRFNVIADLKAPPLESIRATLREDLAQLLAKCQSLGVEPFGFAARAASRFPSLAQWQAYDWPQRFSEAEFDVDVQITVTDT